MDGWMDGSNSCFRIAHSNQNFDIKSDILIQFGRLKFHRLSACLVVFVCLFFWPTNFARFYHESNHVSVNVLSVHLSILGMSFCLFSLSTYVYVLVFVAPLSLSLSICFVVHCVCYFMSFCFVILFHVSLIFGTFLPFVCLLFCVRVFHIVLYVRRFFRSIA
jgi:hypothetical protein